MGEHKGRCFCGAVEFTVTGDPVVMGYCHCESCRHWSAGPVNALTAWAPAAVTVMKGMHNIATFNKTPVSFRKWCRSCGGHLFNEIPSGSVTIVYAALLPTLKFQPSVHFNYQETVLRIPDGLPKLRDFPVEMGGSGLTVPQ